MRLHHLDPRLRLLLALAGLVAVSAGSFRRLWPLVLVAAVLAFVWWWNRLSLVRFLRRWLVVLPIILGFTVLFLLSSGIQHGWLKAAELAVRITLAVAVVFALTATTPVPALLHALGKLGLPSLLLATAAFMHRYGSVFVEELQRMRRARECRTFQPNVFAELRDIGWFLAVLVIRAFERSERVYAAMIARGWQAENGWPEPIDPKWVPPAAVDRGEDTAQTNG